MRVFLWLFLFETFFTSAFATEDDEFSFAVPTEIFSADPARLTATDAAFFFPQIYRGLYRYHTEDGLKPEGATGCTYETKLKLVCTLNEKVRWSDGSKVVAEDYVRGWQNLLAPQSRSPAVELLLKVASFRASAPNKLEIILKDEDPDFLYKLTSPVLVPVKSLPVPEVKNIAALRVNGPYKIASWTPGKKIRLEANPHYPFGHPKRPPVEVYFISDDETVLSLYKEGRIKLVRRLQAHEVPKYKGKPELKEITVARFDYIGFGPELENLPELRKALSLSVDYTVLQKLMDSPGRWGCPSIPTTYMSRVPCVVIDLKAAKEAWAKLPKAVQEKRWKFAFSGAGGDHIKRSAEYFQNQWAKNLGAKIDLEQTENSVFLARLRRDPYAIFRKGVALDRPTCLAALENFIPGAAENFLRLNAPTFNELYQKLSISKSESEKRALCAEGVQYLLDNFRMIPLGRMDFAFLVKPRFAGWHINEMNQLDLSNLHVVK